jgi:hypothetical protein
LKIKIEEKKDNKIIIIKKKDILKDTDFISSEIKKTIETKLNKCFEIKYEKNRIIYFAEKKLNQLLVIHMFQIIEMMKYIFNHSSFEQDIIFFHTNKKKIFPKKQRIFENGNGNENRNSLGPNEINTGATYVNKIDIKNHKGCKIILYRKEEILKVLIHELIHAHLGDIDMILWNDNKKFSTLFCTKYSVLLNEAYTEWYANICNMIYVNIMCKMGRNKLAEMYFNECKYSIYINNKILYFYQISNVEMILRKNKKCTIFFPQQTNVISYYILKNILLLKYRNMKIDSRTIKEVVDLLIKNIYILDEINILYDYSKDLNKSLRLCLYELKI